ncbi:unnamed protein product [Auanema sp. JU1783]|nr:unnamed protein product [Auanema sp. JU1783]
MGAITVHFRIHQAVLIAPFDITKPRRVVLTQQGGDSTSPRRNTVDVQVKEAESDVRRNTIDLQYKEGRSRKNTLELKVNGEVVQTCSDNSQASAESSMPGTPRQPRTFSVVKMNNESSSIASDSKKRTPLTHIRARNDQSHSCLCACCTPVRQFFSLKVIFVMLCLFDIIHWAYLLRDDSQNNPNSWRFYKKFQSFDLYYLVARMFADIFTCVLGLGAAMWTRKPLLTLPCTTIQLLFLFIRAIVWGARSYNKDFVKIQASNEDKVFVVCEFVLPFIWSLLSILIVRSTKRMKEYEQRHGYAPPPIIVLTVKNDENDESVQIEIA